MAPCFRQLKEERKPFSRRQETFVFPSLLPNTRFLPFQRLFSIPFAAAASHGAKACACFPLLFCCKSSSSFSSCCSISNSLFIWSGFGIWVLCNFYGFFVGEGPLYNRAHFLFFTRKRQRLSNSLSISSISLLPFLSFSRYSLMNCFIISSQNTFARHPEAPRITTARSLAESVESSHCASILGISTSSGCIWHGLGLGARIVSFVQQQSLEKTTSSPCTSKRPSTLLLLSNSRLCPLHLLLVWQLSPALCPCTLPSSLPAVHLREGNSGSRPIQSSVIAF